MRLARCDDDLYMMTKGSMTTLLSMHPKPKTLVFNRNPKLLVFNPKI